MSALKPLTQSSQNSLNNNKVGTAKNNNENVISNKLSSVKNAKLLMNSKITKSPIKFRNPLILKTPKINRHLNNTQIINNTFSNKTASDSTIQLDITQVAEKPITSTPIITYFKDDDTIDVNRHVQLDTLQNTTFNLTNQSFLEKDEIVDKIEKLIEISKEKLLSSNFNEIKEINESSKDIDNLNLIKLLSDSLITLKNHSNYHKFETKLMIQNNQEFINKFEVENKLMKKELQRLKLDNLIDDDHKNNLVKHESLKNIAKISIENLDKVMIKNKELTKKFLKYKIKYNSIKDLLIEKNLEIESLKKKVNSSSSLSSSSTTSSNPSSNKTSPPRFKLVHQYDYDHQKQAHESSIISPDHTILTNSPVNKQKQPNISKNNNSNLILPPLSNQSPSKNPKLSRAYDTLNMLASQAISFERNNVKTNDKFLSRSLSVPNVSTKLPGINHLLNSANLNNNKNFQLPKGLGLQEYKTVSSNDNNQLEVDEDETHNLNSNDTIDEEPTSYI